MNIKLFNIIRLFGSNNHDHNHDHDHDDHHDDHHVQKPRVVNHNSLFPEKLGNHSDWAHKPFIIKDFYEKPNTKYEVD